MYPHAVLLDASLTYPSDAPFNPPVDFSEYPFKGDYNPDNMVYPAVRNVFKSMRLDFKNFDTSEWSPLSEFINKGDTVLIKPNLVYDRNLSSDSIFAIITHASLLRIAIDYAYKAAGDDGKIIVADAPQHDANFEQIIEITGIKKMIEYLAEKYSVPIELLDLRKEQVVYRGGVIIDRKTLGGDPRGYVRVDLGKESMLGEIDYLYERFYGADYDRRKVAEFHGNSRHVYVVAKTALESDVIINIPKLKTHMKAGLSIALKNMLGIIGDKNSIVHYRIGSPSEGGDEYPDTTPFSKKLLLKLNRFYSDVFLSRNIGINLYRMLIQLAGGENKFGSEKGNCLTHSGNWQGNDTVWRSIADINRIILYADKNGHLQYNPQRKMFIMVDGIIAGEEQGPLAARAKKSGVIICGISAKYIDKIGARLMGFDERKLPILSRKIKGLSSNEDKFILLENSLIKEAELEELPNLHFQLPRTWPKG